MKPFDLNGPLFLLFFSVVSAATLGALALVLRRRPSGATPIQSTDPYEIAYLRGGGTEVLRIATVGLIEADVLRYKDSKIQVAEKGPAPVHPFDRVLIEAVRQPGLAGFLRSAEMDEACRPYREALVEKGACISEETARRERLLRLAAATLLILVAGVKLAVALSRHKTNVAFLVVLTIGSLLFIKLYRNHRRTQLGDQFLQRIKALMSGSLGRNDSEREELLMLGAVYGLAGLPLATRGYAESIFPNWSRAAGGNGWSSNPSGCGGGGCGGGSCGGGGCGGGGCGGCGGGD
jgi:uncharacterized protein (TIGR04222 family)